MKEQTTSTPATTAIVAQTQNNRAVVPITSVHDLETVGAKYAQSGFFGQISPSQGFLVAQSQYEEGVSVTEWIRRHQVIGNTISWKPNWMLGEFKRLGGKVHIVEATREACEIAFTHWDGETLNVRITMAEMLDTSVPYAKDGKTLKANWQNFADDMLFARVCGKALRRICPEVFCGMYTDAEARDFDAITATTSARQQAAVVASSKSPLDDADDDEDEFYQTDVDYGVCPCGSVKGKRWEDIDTAMLKKILATPAEKAVALAPEHRNEIVKELGIREDLLTEIEEGQN